MSEITRQSTRIGTTLVLSAAGSAILALGFTTLVVAVGSLATMVALATGLVRGSWCTIGAAGGLFFLSLLFADASEAGMEAFLLAAAGSILTWGLADNTHSVGTHLGRETDTLRLGLVHTTATLVVPAAGATVVYGADRAATDGQPITAVALLLIGVVTLVVVVAR